MTMINTNADSGTLDATGQAIVPAIQGSGFRPFSVSLNSASGTREIALSTNGGVTYDVPDYDKNNATELMVGVLTPVTHIRIKGATGDAWKVY